MDKLIGIFTMRPFNPVSRIICLANPESIFKMGPASHVITLDGDTGYAIEANMLHGVRRVKVDEAIKGCKIVANVACDVPNAQAGLEWMRAEAERGAKYDWKGAFGLGIAPDRNWQSPEDWFCFELHAMGMHMAGRTLFRDCARVSSHMLLSAEPRMTHWQERK